MTAPDSPNFFRRAPFTWVILAAATLVAYWPALRGGFLWDDDGHVTKASLRSLAGLGRIWTELGATQQYYPVLHSAFWVEHLLWGDSVLGYHLANIFLHATAAWLFVLILRLLWSSDPTDRIQLSGCKFQPSLLAGLLFALHPVCVESVAWISEQKNTLSLVFYLLSALVYLRGKLPSTGSDSGFRFQVSAFVLFLLALLSKSVTATLPGALLVIVWWRNGRLSWRKDVLPLVPWFVVGLGSGLFTAWVEKSYIGARGGSFGLGGVERCLLAGRAAWFYLGKLLWPADLQFIYPRWTVDAAQAWQYAFPVLALGALLALFALRHRTRGPLACALFFVGSLLPALGFVNVYPFIFSYVADHFQYLASLGVTAGAAWLLARYCRPAGLAVVCVLGVLAWRQAGPYRDVETLYRTNLAANPDSWMSHDNLGVVLAKEGRLDEALQHYQEALRLNPRFPETYNNLGNAYALRGRRQDAREAYENALRLRPDFPEAEFNLGNVLSELGDLGGATLHYGRALAMKADYPEAHYRLGNALANAGRVDAAIPHYETALRLRAAYPEALANLGLAYQTVGCGREALAVLDQAVRLFPSLPEAHAFRGLALSQAGRLGEAIDEYRRALELNPGDGDVRYQLGLAQRALGQAQDGGSGR
jgi:protein O-mannosyl-transferase